MGRFKTYFKPYNAVEYTCSPVLDGWLIIGVSLFFTAIFVADGLVRGFKEPYIMWPLTAIVAMGSLWGVYYVKFRRKPFRREVVLSGWYHRLWLRSKWMFIVVGCAINFVASVIGWTFCTLGFDGFDALSGEFEHKLRGWWILLFALSLNTIRQHIAYYQYYRSPEYRRRMESANEAKKRGTMY